jgi:hypothetical protein
VINAWVGISISPYAVVRSLLVAVASALIVTIISSIILRDARRGALVATAIVAFVVIGRELAVIVGNAVVLLPGWQTAILGVLLVALVVTSWFVARPFGQRLGDLQAWTRGLNVLATVLLLVIVGTGVAKGMVGEAIADLDQGTPLELVEDRPRPQPEGPDIYVILLDAYPRADVLSRRFDYDNAPFLDALVDRGFEVARASHSNYLLTQLSVTSLLHMALVDDVEALQPLIAHAIPEQPTARRLLNHNPTFELLRERGWTIAAFATTYENVSLRQADIFIDGPQLNEFEWQLLASTFVLDVIGWIAPDLIPSQQRERIDSAFDHAAQVALHAGLGPRFLLAHVLAPRTPLVYGPHGEPLDVPVLRRAEDTAEGFGLPPDEYARRLVGQVQYVNDRTIELIDTIVAASPQPPVIIVLSDHGSRSHAFDPATAGPEEIRERFGTLFAAYTPGQEGLFPPDVTPAGVMGRLFEAYFDVPFREPGRGIFASGGSDPFRLIRIGDAPPAP